MPQRRPLRSARATAPDQREARCWGGYGTAGGLGNRRLRLCRSLFRRGRGCDRRSCRRVWARPLAAPDWAAWAAPSSARLSSRPPWRAQPSSPPSWQAPSSVLGGAFFAALAFWHGVSFERSGAARRAAAGGGWRTAARRRTAACCRRRRGWGAGLFVGSILLVGHQAAPLQCLVLSHSTLTGDRQRGGHGQRHRHDCQLGQRPCART
jgi:hypothetical protein